jgi:hypothetical protein
MFDQALGYSIIINAVVCIITYGYLMIADHFPYSSLVLYLENWITHNNERWIVYAMCLSGYYTIMGSFVWIMVPA